MMWRCLTACLLAGLTVEAGPARAHEAHPGYLELTWQSEEAVAVRWNPPMAPGGGTLVELALPEHWELAEEAGVENAQEEVTFEVRVRGASTSGILRFPNLEATNANVYVRVEDLSGTVHTYFASPYEPFVELAEPPGPRERARRLLLLGIHHILLGPDHLLFVLGLLLIVTSTSMLIKTITAFTVAHSLTLALASLGVAAIPIAPLNVCIALSIFLLGPEIVRRWRGQTSLTLAHPWAVAFVFGLLHGFGFASGLSVSGMQAGEMFMALLLFNLGVEAGQLAFVVLVLLLVAAWKTVDMQWPLWLRRAPGYAVGVCGAYWTLDSLATLIQG